MDNFFIRYPDMAEELNKTWENSLETKNPDIAKEWHPTRNGNLMPWMITSGSDKKVWWQCEKGHEWQARINSRVYGNKCPCCAGQCIVVGETDLATINPELAKEWHPTKNGDLTSHEVASGTKRKVWWQCENGHEWQALISNRTRSNKGCPYCSCLMFKNPELADEWHPTKNGELTPDKVTSGSGRKVWWQCKEGHEWMDIIKERVQGKNCPYCGKLAVLHPQVAAEWHPILNYKMILEKVKCGSHKKVWWQCEKGHIWMASVYSRVKGAGCPTCSAEFQSSFPEQAILYYIKKVAIAESRNRDFGKGKEIDVYLPECRIGIEYNGEYYHKSKAIVDERKLAYFTEKGIRIITVKEGKENRVDGDTIEYIYSTSNKESLSWAIKELFNLLKLQLTEIDVSDDTTKIYEQYILMEKENSLKNKCPQVAAEWHPTKNGKMKPIHVLPMSNKKAWWQCKEGHEWQTAISNRSRGSGCPVCYKEKRKKRSVEH